MCFLLLFRTVLATTSIFWGPDSYLSRDPNVFASLVQWLHPGVPHTVPWDQKTHSGHPGSWTTGSGRRGGNPWPDTIAKNKFFPSLYRSILKSKFCLTQRESPRLSCAIFYYSNCLTEARRARKTHQCFGRKGNAELRGLGTWARCDSTSYCTWTEPVNRPHISSLCQMKA